MLNLSITTDTAILIHFSTANYEPNISVGIVIGEQGLLSPASSLDKKFFHSTTSRLAVETNKRPVRSLSEVLPSGLMRSDPMFDTNPHLSSKLIVLR